MKKAKKITKPPVKGQVTSSSAGGSSSAPVVVDQKNKKSDADDLDDIFFAISKKKRSTDAAGNNNNKGPAAGVKGNEVRGKKDGEKKRDGIYRAPEKSIGMSDTEFFGGGAVAAAAAGSGDGSGIATTAGEDALLRQEGVDRILSMNELNKMLSRNPNAGSTPNCPFDCDCCF